MKLVSSTFIWHESCTLCYVVPYLRCVRRSWSLYSRLLFNSVIAIEVRKRHAFALITVICASYDVVITTYRRHDDCPCSSWFSNEQNTNFFLLDELVPDESNCSAVFRHIRQVVPMCPTMPGGTSVHHHLICGSLRLCKSVLKWHLDRFGHFYAKSSRRRFGVLLPQVPPNEIITMFYAIDVTVTICILGLHRKSPCLTPGIWQILA